jgi:hypothetical protein
MNSSEFKKYLSTVSVSHFAIDDYILPIEEYKELFYSYNKFYIDDKNKNTKSSNLLLIELPKLNKEIFKLLNEIVKENSSKEIIIFSKDENSLYLLKFALHFSLNKIYPLNIDHFEFGQILKNIAKKIKIKQEEKNQVEISKKINSLFALLIFKDDKIIFANDKTKEIFQTTSLNDIENIIKNSEEIYKLLIDNKTNSADIILVNGKNEEWKYKFFLETFDTNSNKLLTIIPQKKIENTEAFLTTISRFKFIEYLKDRLAQNAIESTPMSIICINISNYDKLLNVCGSIILHDFVKKFIEKLCFYKGSCQYLSQ